MNHHEGVSCNSCLKINFSGRRYKCLICYDYDLCAECYDEGLRTPQHSANHAMQCILTKADMELFYGGETINSDVPQSFACPFCTQIGFTENTLLDHAAGEHPDTNLEVICPICASSPGGEPNFVTDDFINHLAMDHKAASSDFVAFLEEPIPMRNRRLQRRSLGCYRSRRGTPQSQDINGNDSNDHGPLASILSQISGGQRANLHPTQIQHLRMQIQMERQQLIAVCNQIERLPRGPSPVDIFSSESGPAINCINAIDFPSDNNNMNHDGHARSSDGSSNLSSSHQQPTTFPMSSSGFRDSHGNGNGNGGSSSLFGMHFRERGAHSDGNENPMVGNFTLESPSSSQSNEKESNFLLPHFVKEHSVEPKTKADSAELADISQFVKALLLSLLSE